MKFLKTSAARMLVGSRKLYQLPCTVCGTVTEGTRRKKYCGPACRVKASRDRKKAPLTSPTTPHAKDRAKALASQRLNEQPSALSRASARRLAGARSTVKGNCAMCGNSFKGTVRRRFCSARCRVLSFRLPKTTPSA